MVQVPIALPLSPASAVRAPSAVAMVTNPKPRDRASAPCVGMVTSATRP